MDVVQMKKSLLDVLFMSEKRKGFLLLLKDGAREMEDILKALATNRQSLLPQVRVLEEHYLVNHYDDTYELTVVGKLILDQITPLLNTVDFFDLDIDYWGTRNLDFIPSHLLKRIDSLGKCRIINPSIAEIHDGHKTYHESCARSKYLCAVTTFLYPGFGEMFTGFIANGTKMDIVMSKNLFIKLKSNYYSDFEMLLNSSLMHFFIYPERMDFLSFGYNDYDFVITPFRETGECDSKHLMCSNPEALEWGKELVDHYLKDAVPVSDINQTLPLP